MRSFLIPLAAAIGLAAFGGGAAQAMPETQALAQPFATAAPVRQVQYYEGGDWRARRYEAWRRHEAWREWRRERWVARHEGYPPYGYGRY